MARLQRETFDWWDPFDGGAQAQSPIREVRRSDRAGRRHRIAAAGATSRACPFCGGRASLRGGQAALGADDGPSDTFTLELTCESPDCAVSEFSVSASQPRPVPNPVAAPSAPPDQLAA